MHRVSVRRVIEAPSEDVWAVLEDFGGVASYNPGVLDSGIVAGPETGEGATRYCELDEGGRIEEKIVAYEPGEGYEVDFTDTGDFPMAEMRAEMWVESLGDERSEVTMAADYEPKFGPLGWVLAKVMMNSKLKESFEETLEGLDEYVTSNAADGESGPAAEGETSVASSAD
jgi:carbon monoxide dehydrogenase subunit G